jgi:rod shape-determining protein MreD
MLLSSSSRRPLWVIVASILVAACLNILPIGLMGGYFQPDWVALVLIYWCLWEPERIGAGTGWCAGLLLDLLHGGLLGRFALGKTLLGFVANKVSLRLRAYPVWQQSIGVAVLVLLDTLIHALIRMLLDEETLHLARWMTPLSSMIMWPIVVIVLNPRSRQRRYR